MLETLTEWRSFVQYLLAGFVAWVWWSLKNRFLTKENHVALVAKHDRLEKRVNAIETAIENLPSIKEHHQVIVQQTEMNGHIKKTEASVNRIQHQLDRIEDYLKGK